jgi:hypothetical protein
LTKADISQVMDNLPRSVRALSRSLLLICQLIQSFRRLGLGFGGSPVYGLKRALDAMWLPDNTVSEIEKTHKQSGSPHRLSRSRNSLATVGAPFKVFTGAPTS